jgi:hypothetical protein
MSGKSIAVSTENFLQTDISFTLTKSVAHESQASELVRSLVRFDIDARQLRFSATLE